MDPPNTFLVTSLKQKNAYAVVTIGRRIEKPCKVHGSAAYCQSTSLVMGGMLMQDCDGFKWKTVSA